MHSTPSSLRPVLAAGGALVLLALARPHASDDGAWDLAEPDPAVLITPRAIDVEGHACVECHEDATREWAGSAHALAWVDEAYHEYLEDVRRKDGCYSCHAPKPLLESGGPPLGRPEVRDEPRHHGVDCASCHLGPDGVWLGATGAATDAHATAASPHVAQADALCASCHATTIGPVIGLARDFAKAGMAERGYSCVGCHMAERPLPEDAPEGTRPGRSHALQTPRDPAFLRRAFHLRHVVRDGRSVLVIENRAGHRVPGLKERTITFEVSCGSSSASHTIDTRARLHVDGSVEVPLETTAERISVRALHQDPRADGPVVFIDTDLERE